MKKIACGLIVVLLAANLTHNTHAQDQSTSTQWTYPNVDTNQAHIFGNRGQLKSIPRKGSTYFGQDAQYSSNPPRYQDNGDGTISDLVTGLMWEKQFHRNMNFQQAKSSASSNRTAGYDDWRLPTIKELYSLIDFNGSVTRRNPTPYIDTKYFNFEWGNATNKNARIIDAQYISATEYVGTTMGNQPTVFGVNFADGRIKGYPHRHFSRYVRYVRGNPEYGKNKFVDNSDGTISDQATGLMWTRADSQQAMNWASALKYAQTNKTAGYSDWRLPNSKELQSLVDYTRAPQASDASKRTAAIDPIFDITKAESYFWTSTTHYDAPNFVNANYVCFGRAMGYFSPPRSSQAKQWMDVHGAGAQRSDPKSGNPSRYSQGHGPQGDDIRIYNYVRLVRNINPDEVQIVTPSTSTLPSFSPQSMGGNQGPGADRSSRDGRSNQGSFDRRPPQGGGFPPPRR
ncbi:MAG: DUF1566 domain-containing protein [Phycisphaeraceae bacterium JB051]